MTDDGYVHEVIHAVQRPVQVEVDGKEMPFGRDGAFRVRDSGVADEIKAKYGNKGEVTVTRVKYPHISDRGHKYFFSVPELPWNKEKESCQLDDVESQ